MGWWGRRGDTYQRHDTAEHDASEHKVEVLPKSNETQHRERRVGWIWIQTWQRSLEGGGSIVVHPAPSMVDFLVASPSPLTSELLAGVNKAAVETAVDSLPDHRGEHDRAHLREEWIG